MKKLLTVTLISLLIASCGGGSDGESSPPKDKNLFSLWVEVDTEQALDLTFGNFEQDIPYYVYAEGGEECKCDLRILGTQTSGSYVLNYCVYQYGSGAGDPGCNALNGTGRYSKSSDTLKIISSTGETNTFK